MEDRIPTPGQEGRMLITPEDGSAPYYVKITMADNPTNPGTPLNKETLLQDATETALFGSANNRTVDQAFRGIASKIDLIMGDQAAITLTVKDSAGNGIPGVLVSGVFGEDGGGVYTNSSGVITGYVSEGLQTLQVSGYLDIEDTSMQLDVVKGQTYNETLTVTTRNFVQITNTQTVKFSENVQQVDVNPVGAGGGGDVGWQAYDEPFNWPASGPGGGGGHSVIQNAVSFLPNTLYPAVVGAGGPQGSDGGTSSFMGVSASGGKGGQSDEGANTSVGGAGNGNGGNGWASSLSGVNGNDGRAGGNATESGFKNFTETQLYGGGGGSGARTGEAVDDFSGGSGGAPYGGDGGDAGDQWREPDGSPGNGFGGGGGGGARSYDRDEVSETGQGGSGYQGCINVRMHLKSAS